MESIKKYLPLVRRPSRYIGGEVNSVVKDPSKVRLRFGLGFPDTYEVGMSHLGMHILYQVLNSRDDVFCERVFAPWTDMEALLREKGIPLSTLETETPLERLDIMGFSLQYELSYTNVLNMLELGRIPLLSRERQDKDPVVIGGGPSAFNPEPVAEFFDAFLVGDGEEAVLEMADAVIEAKAGGRGEVLRRLARIPGVYVPSFFRPAYNPDGTLREIEPLHENHRVKKRVVADIEKLPLYTRPVVPFAETVHDRVSIEIARGCTRGCRFCQAGMTYRPARERSPETIVRAARETLESTGYDEVSLLSLSTGDYSCIGELLPRLMEGFVGDRVAVSFPSLRVGTIGEKLASEIKKVRKTGFTLAPEAGSTRLRGLINKGIREEDLIKGAEEIFSLGWRSIKLYFMIGLPTETDEDVLDIARLAEKVRKAGKRASGRTPQVTVSASSFIPKPFTPFQWEAQATVIEIRRKQELLKKGLSRLRTGFKWHDPEMSLLEGVFSRGDRRLAPVILRAFRLGARFDGWTDRFDFNLWQKAFDEEGVDPESYTRGRGPAEVFPWDHIDSGVARRFLLRERENALALKDTPDCKAGSCSACGLCDHKAIKNVIAAASAPGEAGDRAVSRGGSFKVRLRFTKTGDARFLSHLELMEAVKRSVRRAGLQVKYSEGFHPMPRISFSAPLPVGLESLDEHIEIGLEGEGAGTSEVLGRLNSSAPAGIRFYSPLSLKIDTPSAMIGLAEYLVTLKDGPGGIHIEPERIDGFLRDFYARDSIPVEVRKEDKVATVDLKPLLKEFALVGGDTLKLVLREDAAPRVRPRDILVSVFGLTAEEASLIPILKTKSACSQ